MMHDPLLPVRVSPPAAEVELVFDTAGQSLIASSHSWRNSTTGRPRVPLPLCEFLAYKTALAYETDARIKVNLQQCCQGIDKIAFFDARLDGVADTQGYGFRYEGKAFIILRGSESEIDWWVTNVEDTPTHALTGSDDTRLARLTQQLSRLKAKNFGVKDRGSQASFGVTDALAFIGGKMPSRHLGFAIGWAAVRADIDAWIAREGLEHSPFAFAGHSLGGALAILGAHEFKKTRSRDVAAVVAFGAPSMGDAEFAAEYETLGLKERTIHMVSGGDLVPALMKRWYYRPIWYARQFFRTKTIPQHFAAYGDAGQGWRFEKYPPLSSAQLVAEIATVQEALQKVAKSTWETITEDAKRMAEKEGDKASAKEGDKVPTPKTDAKTKDSDTQDEAKPADTQTSTDEKIPNGTTKGNKDGGVDWRVVAFVVFIVLVVAAFIVWSVIRNRVASHAIQERYALFLSTLAYQRLRMLHPGNLDGANADLEAHLRFIRGETKIPGNIQQGQIALGQTALGQTALGQTSFYDALKGLPVRLKKDHDMPGIMAKSGNYLW